MPYMLQFDPADTPMYARQGCGTYRVYALGSDGKPEGDPVTRGVSRGFGETRREAQRWNATIETGRRRLDPADSDGRSEVWTPWPAKVQGLPSPWTSAHTKAHRAARRT